MPPSIRGTSNAPPMMVMSLKPLSSWVIISQWVGVGVGVGGGGAQSELRAARAHLEVRVAALCQGGEGVQRAHHAPERADGALVEGQGLGGPVAAQCKLLHLRFGAGW